MLGITPYRYARENSETNMLPIKCRTKIGNSRYRLCTYPRILPHNPEIKIQFYYSIKNVRTHLCVSLYLFCTPREQMTLKLGTLQNFIGPDLNAKCAFRNIYAPKAWNNIPCNLQQQNLRAFSILKHSSSTYIWLTICWNFMHTRCPWKPQSIWLGA